MKFSAAVTNSRTVFGAIHMCRQMVMEQIGVCGFAGIISTVDYTTEACCVVSRMFVRHACVVCVSVQYVCPREVSFTVLFD